MKANQKLGERTIAAGHYSREKDYWLKRLSGEPVKVSFPYDFQDKDQTGKNFNTRTFRFCGDIHSRLLSLSKGLDYTLHMILTAALTLLLDKYNGSGNKDIIVSSPIYHQEIEADFVNTVLALRNYLAHNMTFKDLLLQVRQTIAEATENQNYPIDTLLYQLDVPLTGEDFPLFDTAILLENIHDKKYLRDIHFNMIKYMIKFHSISHYQTINGSR